MRYLGLQVNITLTGTHKNYFAIVRKETSAHRRAGTLQIEREQKMLFVPCYIKTNILNNKTTLNRDVASYKTVLYRIVRMFSKVKQCYYCMKLLTYCPFLVSA